MVSAFDVDKDRKISFLELCCGLYEKSIDALNDFVDDDARAAALALAMAAGEAARKAEEAIELARLQQEQEAAARAAKLEAESKLVSELNCRTAPNTLNISDVFNTRYWLLGFVVGCDRRELRARLHFFRGRWKVRWIRPRATQRRYLYLAHLVNPVKHILSRVFIERGRRVYIPKHGTDRACFLVAIMYDLPQIKEEAAMRRALREAKQKQQEAEAEANKKKSSEDIAREIKEASERQAAEEARIKAEKDEEERQARAARKAALNAKWGGGGSTSPPAPK
jgi:hypothetical protein